MTPHQTQQRGIEAKRILDNAVFQESLIDLKAQIVRKLLDCPLRDVEGALLLRQLATLCDTFTGLLVGRIESGKLAESQININAVRNEAPIRQFFRRGQ